MIMTSKVVLITGANTGLGLEIVKALYKSSKAYNIMLGSRSIDKGAAAKKEVESEHANSSSTIEVIQIDIEDDNSINSAFEHVSSKHGKLDVLINNAGASFDQAHARGEMSFRDAWNRAYSLNTTSTHINTHTFAPLLLQSADPHLIFIASGTASLANQAAETLPIDKAPPGGWPKASLSLSAYRASKTGMNMMMREWARMLKEDGVKVWAVSPGLLITGLGGSSEAIRKMGGLDPRVGGEFVKDVVEGARDGDAGKVVANGGKVQPW